MLRVCDWPQNLPFLYLTTKNKCIAALVVFQLTYTVHYDQVYLYSSPNEINLCAASTHISKIITDQEGRGGGWVTRIWTTKLPLCKECITGILSACANKRKHTPTLSTMNGNNRDKRQRTKPPWQTNRTYTAPPVKKNNVFYAEVVCTYSRSQQL